MKRRDMELQVEQLNAQVQALNKQVETYHAQEQAIVQALTQAQSSASLRVAEAEAQAQKIIQDAEAKKNLLASEADQMVQDATARAASIVEAAQAESARRLAQTEASVQDFEVRLRALNTSLNDAARQARIQAETFAKSLDTLKDETPEILAEGKGLCALINTQTGKLPEEYKNPQELMHGIYQLQGREIPAETVISAKEPAPEPQASEPQKPEPEPPAPQQPDPVDEDDEERVWTVDEVIGKGAADYPQSVADLSDEDVDLDSLLDEIIKE